LAEGLRDNNCIKELDISNNYCSDHVMYVLIMALRNNNELRYLNVSRTGCESKAVEGFCELIVKSNSLVYIDFSYNYLYDEDLMKISNNIVENWNIMKLVITDVSSKKIWFDKIKEVLVRNRKEVEANKVSNIRKYIRKLKINIKNHDYKELK